MGYQVHITEGWLILIVEGMGLRIYCLWRIREPVMLKLLLRGDRITFYYSTLIEAQLSNRYVFYKVGCVMVGTDDRMVY